MVPCYKTFISIGNGKQYFSRLLGCVEENSDLLPKPILVQAGHTPFISETLTVTDFVSMDHFIQYMNQAEVLILHAGAGSVLNAIKAGKRPIVMPRLARFDEVVNDHQVPFAKMLQAEGKVMMVENAIEMKAAIQKTLSEGIALQTDINSSRAFKVIETRLKALFSVE